VCCSSLGKMLSQFRKNYSCIVVFREITCQKERGRIMVLIFKLKTISLVVRINLLSSVFLSKGLFEQHGICF
jgi:hypothetical protein